MKTLKSTNETLPDETSPQEIKPLLPEPKNRLQKILQRWFSNLSVGWVIGFTISATLFLMQVFTTEKVYRQEKQMETMKQENKVLEKKVDSIEVRNAVIEERREQIWKMVEAHTKAIAKHDSAYNAFAKFLKDNRISERNALYRVEKMQGEDLMKVMNTYPLENTEAILIPNN